MARVDASAVERRRQLLTVGVEEEFLLLNPDGTAAPVASQVLRLADQHSQLTPEFMAYQIETATSVCTRLDDLRAEVVRLRSLAASSAERAGVQLVSVGMPPYRSRDTLALTEEARYVELARRFPAATDAAGGACACQVHVGVPDREVGVEVLARLRPWLPTLLALTGNSAVVGGTDSGWSSYRYRMLTHWPTFRPPGIWSTAARYDDAVRSFIECGAADSDAGVYLLARLSARYPTVEIRVADACLTPDDTLLFAGVVRALVATLMDDTTVGRRIEPLSHQQVSAGLLTAARRGVHSLAGGDRIHPAFRDLRFANLLDTIMPALVRLGDVDEVIHGFERFSRIGTGADRQRALLASAVTPHAFVAALAGASAPAVTVG